MTTPIQFWSNDPTIIMNKDYILEVWPTPKMTFEQKLNAISRLIIILTILGFIFTMSTKLLLVGIITLIVIFALYNSRKQKVTKEMFQNRIAENNNPGNALSSIENSGIGKIGGGEKIVNPETLEEFLRADFEPNTKANPFANVLLTDIGDNPDRKSAPPSFNPDVYEDITHSVKKMVQKLNPGIKNTNKQLFGDLGENFYLDQSNRNFFSTANTRIANDQGAFAEFLYGTMPSSKESGPLSAMQRVADSYRYTLY
jgi:hypothetical protein